MVNFTHTESNRPKLSRSTRRRLSPHEYLCQQKENIHHVLGSVKLIYAMIFIVLTIFMYVHQSYDDDDRKVSRSIFVCLWDIWYSFLALVLLVSILIDHTHKRNLKSMKWIYFMKALLIILLVSLVILGHVRCFSQLWWSTTPSLSSSICATFISTVIVDLCPISIVIYICIIVCKRRRSWYHTRTKFLVSSV